MRISDWSSECALPISIDRERVARTLGFDEVCRNSLDAVSDRDFAIAFCASAALIMTHISRLSEELVLWMSPRVGFIDLADRFCPGTSIMPQTKNPHVPEHIVSASCMETVMTDV